MCRVHCGVEKIAARVYQIPLYTFISDSWNYIKMAGEKI